MHWVMMNSRGTFERVKVLDPSFLNWHALSYALLKNIVRDFPLCDKSFNRSYSGTILTRGREFRDDQWLCFRCRRTGSVIRAV
jgi:Ni,Fe-hydrogenase III large subunit